MKEFAEFDENGRKFSRQVENTVGKGEIGRNEKALNCKHVKTRLIWERVKDGKNIGRFFHKSYLRSSLG